MKPSIPVLFAITQVLCLSAPAPSAQAGVTMAVCQDGGPGSTRQAASALELFLRHMEKTAGLESGALKGAYQTSRAACETYVKEQKVGLAVLDLPTLLSRLDGWKLQPIAHMGSHDARRYHVLVRQGEAADLAGLKDKVVYVSGSNDPAYVYGLLLDQKVPRDHFKMKRARRALKGVRAVARGKADGTLVEADVVEHLGDLDLPTTLTSIHASQGLPGLTLVVVGLHAPEGSLVKKLEAALPRLCDGEGAKLCKTFRVKAFKKANATLYKDLATRLR